LAQNKEVLTDLISASELFHSIFFVFLPSLFSRNLSCSPRTVGFVLLIGLISGFLV